MWFRVSCAVIGLNTETVCDQLTVVIDRKVGLVVELNGEHTSCAVGGSRCSGRKAGGSGSVLDKSSNSRRATMSARSLTGISTHSNCSLTLRVNRRIGWRRPRNIRRKESRQKLLNRRLDCSNTNAKLSRALGRRRRQEGITFNRSSPGKFDVFSPYRSRVRRRRAVHRTVVQRTNVTRIKIIRCVFRSKGTFQQGSTEIEIQNAVRLFFPVRVVKRREEICRVAANFDYAEEHRGGVSLSKERHRKR